MGRLIPFLLGLFGGLIGIFAAILALGVGGLGSVFGAEGASEVISLGLGAFAFSLLGIVGAAIVNYKTKLAGWLMIIAAVGGLISISAFYIVSFVLLLLGGILTLKSKEE